jgi:murein DD-endopeptidase MepM/ murein hydrolase activator NlpD
MDIRTATQMEKARRNAVAISTLLVVLMLGLTTTFIAMSFVKHDNGGAVQQNTGKVVNGPNNPVITATWVMPVEVATATVLKAADFEMPQYNNTTKWYEFDLGYTLGANAGTKVVACYDGEVTSVVESGDASTGKLVRIKHKDGVETVYSSLDAITVAVGDKVKSGDQIGTVGNTANYEVFETPHVRLMAYKNGKPVNPENFVEFPGSENK